MGIFIFFESGSENNLALWVANFTFRSFDQLGIKEKFIFFMIREESFSTMTMASEYGRILWSKSLKLLILKFCEKKEASNF